MTIADGGDLFSTIEGHIQSLKLRDLDKIHFVRNNTVGRLDYIEGTEAKKKSLRMRTSSELISAGEYATIMALHSYCKAETSRCQRAYVVYFHNKGAKFPKIPSSPVSDWRDEMNAFILEFPSICLRAMNDGFSS